MSLSLSLNSLGILPAIHLSTHPRDKPTSRVKVAPELAGSFGSASHDDTEAIAQLFSDAICARPRMVCRSSPMSNDGGGRVVKSGFKSELESRGYRYVDISPHGFGAHLRCAQYLPRVQPLQPNTHLRKPSSGSQPQLRPRAEEVEPTTQQSSRADQLSRTGTSEISSPLPKPVAKALGLPF